jgi:hypothetical protein
MTYEDVGLPGLENVPSFSTFGQKAQGFAD